MTTDKQPGRPSGGRCRIWHRVATTARSERARDLAWSAVGGVIGGAIGMFFAAVWLRYR